MKNNININHKEFDPLDEGQKMEIKEEGDYNTVESQSHKNNIILILFGLSIFISIGLGIAIYHKSKEERFVIPLENQEENAQAISDSDKNKTNQNNNIISEYKEFELQHYKPDDLNLNKYKEFLPKKKNNSTITDLTEIFDSDYLYITNSKMSFDYIYTLREKDFEKKERKNITFQNDGLDFYKYETKEGQISLRDFYELCEDEKKINTKKVTFYSKPLISVIIAVYNEKQNLLRTIRSIQNQSLKNIEIIIISDNDINMKLDFLSKKDNKDPRIRVFIQDKSYGLWRKRMDGFLYSKGKYILHVNAGDILADNYILDDIYNLAEKYELDTVRFSFSKTNYTQKFTKNKNFEEMKIFPPEYTKILYGRPNYDLKELGYGTIWNRLVKADIFSKGLDLVDSVVLNIKKNLWEDIWWNELIDRVSYSSLIINRLGYIFLYDKNITYEQFKSDKEEKDKAIREFIYFCYFNLILQPQNDEKKLVINYLRQSNQTNNMFCNISIQMNYLENKSEVFLNLVKKLLSDNYVAFMDKVFVKDLSDYVRHMLKEKKDQEKARKKEIEKSIAIEKEKEKKLQLMKEKEQKQIINNTFINKTNTKIINNSNHGQMNNSSNNNLITKIMNNTKNQYNNINKGQINKNLIQNPIPNNQGYNNINQQPINQNNINPNIQNNNLVKNNLININQMQQYNNRQINNKIINNQPYINNNNQQIINNNQNNLYNPINNQNNQQNQNNNLNQFNKINQAYNNNQGNRGNNLRIQKY